MIQQDGDIIGPFSDAIFGVTEFSLSPGDRFLLYSDGLVETGGDREEGIRRLAKAGEAHRNDPLESMLGSVVADLTGGREVRDDVLLLGVEV